MQLYKIIEQYKNVIVDLESIDELDDKCVKDTLESLELGIDDKIINSAAYIKNLNHNINAIESAIYELNDRKSKLNNIKTSLIYYIKDYMESSGKNKIKGELFDVYVRENQLSVDIFDDKFLAEDDSYDRFVKKKTLTSYDKMAIKDYLKAGGKITGVRLVRSKSVVIK